MIDEVANKRLKLTPPLIATHNGTFHADEALAVYLLRLLPTYQPSTLVRTRDPALLQTCHTVVDVGGDYSHESLRYDHHQRTFNHTFPSHSTKLSSAGLVYLHYGRAIISLVTSLDPSHPDVELLYQKMYDEFIEPIDANDNGISAYDPSLLESHPTGQVKKRFNDSGISLSALVADLNYDLSDDPYHISQATETEGAKQAPVEHPDNPQAAEDARFDKASGLMGTVFLRKLRRYWLDWLPARDKVKTSFDKRFDVDTSGKIMVLDEGAAWKDHLYNFERETGNVGKVWYVLYPEQPTDGSKWRVQCVPVAKDSFESRRPLKEEWRGVRDAELSKVSGIDGCVFCHASGFIGGNVSKEGALEMARMSML